MITIALSIALQLSSFSSFSDKGNPNIYGKWYASTGTSFSKKSSREDIARWYKFQFPNQVTYSSCTDMCGCMRIYYSGVYAWENDSILAIEYDKFKEEFDQDNFKKLDKPKTERLLIRGHGRVLSISRL